MSDIPNPNIVGSSKGSTSEVNIVLKRNSDDIGWEFGRLCNAINPDKWKCLKCGKEYSGGVNRIKQHIAGVKGNVAKCLKASIEEQKRCLEALEGARKKKVQKKESNEEARREVDITGLNEIERMEMEEREVSLGSKMPRTLGPIDKHVSQIKVDDTTLSRASRQQNINDALFKERTFKVHEYLARWAYENGIPFNTLDNNSFRRLMEAVGQFGSGYIPPSQYLLGTPLLKGEVERTKKLLKTQEEEWEMNGCSIMTDSWSDRNRRSIMNLCVNSRIGTAFISSKEASEDAHTGEYIYEYVSECINLVGEKNVVQVVTDNASNNMAASLLLYGKMPSIFWTSCATHTINLMLEGIGKLAPFKNTIAKAKDFTIFIYSHHKTLALMRKCTKREIVRPGVTRFASTFLTLQSLLEKRELLFSMVGSVEWQNTKWSRSKPGKAAYATIVQPNFWNDVSLTLQVFAPLVRVLRLVDGDVKPAMGFLHGEMIKAKEEIKKVLKNKEDKYKPVLDVVASKGNG